MAETIQQEFLINANQALDMLGRLDQGFLRFETRLRSTANTIASFNSAGGGQAFQNLARQLNSAASSLNNVTTQARNAANAVNNLGGTRSVLESLAGLTDRAGISFETFARIIQAQVIVRAINQIRDALFEAVETAGQLQQQVALIETIATAAPGRNGERVPVETEQISQATREISDSLNIPQLEVAEGLYNAISNQVGDFAESLQFTAEAGRFARATNATLAESVDTLSAVLRTYRLNADQTSRVSDVLFATIDKGRVTADELANTLGRVLPAANELGVSLEEVGAAVATISVGGLSTDETLTQIRATFSGLLKPSDSLKQAFENIGVASGEAGIRTFGFVGFLNRLREETGGSSAELAKLFPNVRNLGGVLALTAEQGQLYAQTLQDISNTEGLNDAAFDIVTSTPFEELASTANQARNALTQLGDEIVADAVAFQEFVGGSDNVVASIDFLARGLVALVPVAAAAGTALIATSNAARVLLVALNANPIVLATTAIVGLGVALREFVAYTERVRRDGVLNPLDELAEFESRQIEVEIEKVGRAATQAGREFDEGLTQNLIGATDASREYLKIIPQLEQSNADVVGFVTDTLDTIVDARRNYARELERAAKDAEQIAQRSVDRAADLRSELDGRQFDRSLRGLNEAQQVFQLTQRSSELATAAAAQLTAAARTGDERGIDRALALFDEAQSLADNAESIAESTGNRALEARAVQAVTNSLRQQISAEQTLQQIQDQRQAALELEQKRQEAIANEVQRQAKIVLENTSLFNNQGEQFSDREVADRSAARNQALSRLLDLQFSQGDFDLANVLGLAEFARKFETELGSSTTELQVTLQNRGQEVADQVSQALGNFNTDPFVQRLKTAAGVALSEAVTPEQLEDLASRAEQRFRNFQADQSTNIRANLRAEADLRNAESIVEQIEKLNNARQDQPLFEYTLGARDLSLELEEATTRLRGLIEAGADGDVIATAFQEQKEQLQELLNTQKERGDTSFQAFTLEAELFERLRLSLKSYAEEQAKAVGATEKLEGITETDFQGISNAANSSGTLSNNMKAAALSAQQFANAVNSARVPSVPAKVAFGGFFANGGVTRGVDNILTSVTAGESVLNAQATSRFFSQIQAMNAGQQPVFREQGGPVTNIGDINVNVSTTAGGVDGRQIAESLRRELRRNSNSLRR